jgi:AcrR family transcriptional regulator
MSQGVSVNERASSRRQEHAELTRLAVIEAAHRLFVAQGYTSTSIREIASEARVSEQTVYRIFGDKAELLRTVILAAVTGPDDARALRESDRMETLAAATTAAERLRVVAGWARESYERGLAQLESIVQSAASASADRRVAELARFIAEQRYEDTRSLVHAILGGARLPIGVEVTDVVDYVYAVESSAVYTTLTADRGWTTDKYVEWFVRLFETMFLDAAADATRGAPASAPGR